MCFVLDFKKRHLMNYFNEILTILVSVATVTALIVWSIKEVIKKILQADTERQKFKLQLEQQRFTILQVEQLDGIKIIYSNLVKTEDLFTEMLSLVKENKEITEQVKAELLKPLIQSLFDSLKHFKQNRIFLTKSLALKIGVTIDNLFSCITKSSYALIVKSEEIYSNNGDYLGIRVRKIEELLDKDKLEFKNLISQIEYLQQNQLKESIEALEVEFRGIFGVKQRFLFLGYSFPP